jgi:hypothetical protein
MQHTQLMERSEQAGTGAAAGARQRIRRVGMTRIALGVAEQACSACRPLADAPARVRAAAACRGRGLQIVADYAAAAAADRRLHCKNLQIPADSAVARMERSAIRDRYHPAFRFRLRAPRFGRPQTRRTPAYAGGRRGAPCGLQRPFLDSPEPRHYKAPRKHQARPPVVPNGAGLSMIPKSGNRFPACAKPFLKFVVGLDASGGEGRSEKIMLHEKIPMARSRPRRQLIP